MRSCFLIFIKRVQEDDVFALASQLAYSFLLSIFPFLIFLMTLLGYSSIKSEEVLVILREALPINAYELIRTTVIEVVDYKNIHLMSISILAAIWTASSGFNAVIKALNKAYDEKEKRAYWKIQCIAIVFTIVLAFIITATLILLVFGQLIGNAFLKWLGLTEFSKVAWNVLRYTILLLSMIFTFMLVYHYTPCRRLTWKEGAPGAIFSTIGWVIISMGFAFYVNQFGNYSKIYGSIGAVIALLTWLFFTSIIILLGGEVNAFLASTREKRPAVKGKMETHKLIPLELDLLKDVNLKKFKPSSKKKT